MKLNAPDYWKVKKTREMYGVKNSTFGDNPFVVIEGTKPNINVRWFKSFQDAYEYGTKKGKHPWVIAQTLG